MPLASGGPLPPYIGCFTLISPATTAEGLCCYNSGYLHWVRNTVSHTHSHTLIISPCHSSQTEEHYSHCHREQPSPSHPSLKPCLKLRASCITSIIAWFVLIVHFEVVETLLRCLLLKCWQVFFSALLHSDAYRDLFRITKLSGFTAVLIM